MIFGTPRKQKSRISSFVALGSMPSTSYRGALHLQGVALARFPRNDTFAPVSATVSWAEQSHSFRNLMVLDGRTALGQIP
jgi:hypothetical protein